MTQNNCKYLVRYVAPKRFRNSPPLTILSLPREIRDAIYDLALVSPSPIIVWKGHVKTECCWNYVSIFLDDQEDARIISRPVDKEATVASLRSLVVSLMFCNKTISYEASLRFYGLNTFAFMGSHNWDPIVSWLAKIGPTHRNSLRSLEIEAYRPDIAWQRPNGERTRHKHYTREEVYPRHPYLHLGTDERFTRAGIVDNINPAAETIFTLLGERTSEQETTVVMRLPHGFPGHRDGFLDPFYYTPEYYWYGMDLPNLIERFRSLHTPRMSVLWKGKYSRKYTEQDGPYIKSIGWDMVLLPAAEDKIFSTEWGPRRHANFILESQGVAEPLLSQPPYVLP